MQHGVVGGGLPSSAKRIESECRPRRRAGHLVRYCMEAARGLRARMPAAPPPATRTAPRAGASGPCPASARTSPAAPRISRRPATVARHAVRLATPCLPLRTRGCRTRRRGRARGGARAYLRIHLRGEFLLAVALELHGTVSHLARDLGLCGGRVRPPRGAHAPHFAILLGVREKHVENTPDTRAPTYHAVPLDHWAALIRVHGITRRHRNPVVAPVMQTLD